MRALLFTLFLLNLVTPTYSIAPHCDATSRNLIFERNPAQVKKAIKVKKLEYYLSLGCRDLVGDKNVSNDSFLVFLRAKLERLHPNICTIVKDSKVEENETFSQASLKTIGEGTFSRLVEINYNTFNKSIIKLLN